MATAKKHWASDWKVGVRVWVERQGHAVLGEGRAELLAAIASEHSITKAAKAAGMSYRRAWTMIQEVNKAAGEALVEAAVGGKQGAAHVLRHRGYSRSKSTTKCGSRSWIVPAAHCGRRLRRPIARAAAFTWLRRSACKKRSVRFWPSSCCRSP